MRMCATALGLALSVYAMATFAGPVATQAEACSLVTKAFEKRIRPPKKSDEYYCQPYRVSKEYFVFSLRSRYPAPPGTGHDWVGSDLIDYLAVRRKDGEVLMWDFPNDEPGPVLSKKNWP